MQTVSYHILLCELPEFTKVYLYSKYITQNLFENHFATNYSAVL